MMLKRKTIDDFKKIERKSIFNQFLKLKPKHSQEVLVTPLEDGNKKTGTSSSFFSHIYVWNLPPCVTCPGASKWCQSHCYNLDTRKDVYDIDKWCGNWWYAINDTESLENSIISQILNVKSKSIAVRLHSSGDFFSLDYINMWIRICTQLDFVKFWGYTRSWSIPELNDSILKLSKLKNVNLFASIDATMRGVPQLKVSITVDTNEEIESYKKREHYIICPEQYNLISNCANCTSCINKSSSNVVFISH